METKQSNCVSCVTLSQALDHVKPLLLNYIKDSENQIEALTAAEVRLTCKNSGRRFSIFLFWPAKKNWFWPV